MNTWTGCHFEYIAAKAMIVMELQRYLHGDWILLLLLITSLNISGSIRNTGNS